MKNELKTVWRLLPYAMQFKLMTIFAVFMVITGVLLKIFFLKSPIQYTVLSDWFLWLVPMYLIQMIQSVFGMSGLLQSSPTKKAALTRSSALLYTLWLLATYTFLATLNAVGIALHPEAVDVIKTGTLYSLAILILFTVYNVLAYRYYLISMAVLLVVAVFFGATGGFRLGELVAGAENVPFFFLPVPDALLALPFSAYFIFGYVVTLLAGLLYYALSLAFYKIPISERVFRSALRKYGN